MDNNDKNKKRPIGYIILISLLAASIVINITAFSGKSTFKESYKRVTKENTRLEKLLANSQNTIGAIINRIETSGKLTTEIENRVSTSKDGIGKTIEAINRSLAITEEITRLISDIESIARTGVTPSTY